VVHSPFGAQVHAPWALVVAARLQERFGVNVQAMHADDGLVFRLPDTDWDDSDSVPNAERPGDSSRESGLSELLALIFPDPEDVAANVTELLGGSALFAARFRECAGRALLLPNRRPGKRQALWQQRLRSSQLLQVASSYPDFPIVLEAVRECVNDVFDVPSLVELMSEVRSRTVTTVAVDTPHPSPFASSLQFGYVAQFLYDDDSPLAERRAAALSLDPRLLAELLGTAEGLALADLLDAEALTATEQELQHLTPGRKARDAEDVTDLLRMLGPLTTEALAARTREPASLNGWLAELTKQHQVLALPEHRWAVVDDAARVRDALGLPLPAGIAAAFLTSSADPLGDLLSRYARTHTVFTAAEAAEWLGLSPSTTRDGLRRLVAAGKVVEGELRPPGWHPPAGEASTRSAPRSRATGSTDAPTVAAAESASTTALSPSKEVSAGAPTGAQFCDAGVLRIVRRRSLAALRHGIEPVSTDDFARFLPRWQGVGRLRGVEGVLRAIDQLAGVPLPASAWESLILPSRVTDYVPAMLDELTASGELLWQGHGAIGAGDGWLSLHPTASAPSTLTEPSEPLTTEGASVLTLLGDGGHFFASLAQRSELTSTRLAEVLWELAWSGRISNDTLAGLRSLLTGGTSAHRSRPQPARGRHRPALTSAALTRQLTPPQTAGRWSALPEPASDPTLRAVARAELLLDRYGILTRGSVAAEQVPGGFGGIYRVLSVAEEAGRIRRGYFIDGLGAAQFGDSGAVDRLREHTDEADRTSPEPPVVLAATDPANPYGAALAWPSRAPSGHQPSRKAGALVVLLAGRLVLYVERGGRTLLSWTDDPALLEPAAAALAEAVHAGVLGRLTVTKLDGQAALGSSQPLAQALTAAGFGLTPQGLRLRR
jgi:ATP-dependent helicase Lhr and Lhr-like helicase